MLAGECRAQWVRDVELQRSIDLATDQPSWLDSSSETVTLEGMNAEWLSTPLHTSPGGCTPAA